MPAEPVIAERTGSGSALHARALSGAPGTSASIGRDVVSDLDLRLPRLVNVMLTPERCRASFVAVCGHTHHNARVMKADARSDLTGKGSLFPYSLDGELAMFRKGVFLLPHSRLPGW